MRKRRRSLIFGVLFAALGSVIWALSFPREQIYQGRPLGAWLQGYNPTIPNSTGWKEAEEAVRQTGARGIPTLLKLLRRHDPAWKMQLASLLRKFGIRKTVDLPAQNFNLQGQNGFEVLGPSASNAVPELMKIYRHDYSPASQRATLVSLAAIGGPAGGAIPLMVSATTNADASVRFAALEALRRVHADDEIRIHALASALQDSDATVRENAAYWLMRFGPKARAAVPALIPLLTHTNQHTRETAEDALHVIDPSAAGKALAEGPK